MKQSTPVAVTSRSFSNNPVLRAELLEKYENVTFNSEGLSLKGENLIAFLQGHEKAITALEVLDADVFERLPELKVISKYGVGINMIDLEAMVRFNKKLGWTKGVNRRSVSELVISLAIGLLRHVPEGSALVRDGGWRQFVGRQLSDCTVGIIGCGFVGKDLATLLKGFGCKIWAHDILDFPEFYRQHEIRPSGLEELLESADVVTLHLPLDETTTNILNADRLNLMRSDAILINTARGGLVDEEALKTMLIEKRLAGAALDVFDREPPMDKELLSLPNFWPTPHIGGSAREAILAMGRAAIEGLDNASLPDPKMS